MHGVHRSLLARQANAVGVPLVEVEIPAACTNEVYERRTSLAREFIAAGENGEFHTFVYAGPILSAPLTIQIGETVERDGFVFTDLTADGLDGE